MLVFVQGICIASLTLVYILRLRSHTREDKVHCVDIRFEECRCPFFSQIATRIKGEKDAMQEQREAEEDLAIFMNQRLVKEVGDIEWRKEKSAGDVARPSLDSLIEGFHAVTRWGSCVLISKLSVLSAKRLPFFLNVGMKVDPPLLSLSELQLFSPSRRPFC